MKEGGLENGKFKREVTLIAAVEWNREERDMLNKQSRRKKRG
jgi:hypothetical protein